MRQANILLVDDHPENLLALEAFLQDVRPALRFIRAACGEQALKAVLQYDFAVILLDVHMQDMDGFETASLIKEREKSQFTPIVFLTAYDDGADHIFRGYSVGVVDYLVKPIVPEILRAKVATFVDLYVAHERLREIDRQKVQFLTHASHELRTPLASVEMCLYLLEHDVEGKRAEHWDRLKKQVSKLDDALQHILSQAESDD